MDHHLWQAALLSELESSSEEGLEAVRYLRGHKTHIGFGRARPSVAAVWTPLRNIRLNRRHYRHDNALGNPYLLSILVHEVCHLRQGFLVALSIYGELEAWQLQFRLYQRLAGMQPSAAIRELLALPLGLERATLRRARELMQAHAGRGYLAHWLPLYPLAHWVRRPSVSTRGDSRLTYAAEPESMDASVPAQMGTTSQRRE